MEQASATKKKADKIAILKKNDSPQLRALFQLAWDPRYKWLLPEGPVPYTPNRFPDCESIAYHVVKKFYLFVDGIPKDSQQQVTWDGLIRKGKRGTIIREQRFIEMLENMAPKDAELICAVKDKKIPFKGLDPELINETWPGLLPPLLTYTKAPKAKANADLLLPG